MLQFIDLQGGLINQIKTFRKDRKEKKKKVEQATFETTKFTRRKSLALVK